MKIEKINDRQIRCVLTKEELESRKIRLSEIVCGGEKARGLFRDMMLMATRELGFSFNNNPLMIEAVPTGKDQLVLIITRVDDPGELDSRFRHLSAFQSSEKEKNVQNTISLTGADDILNLLRRFAKQLEERKASSDKAKDGGRTRTDGEGVSADEAKSKGTGKVSGEAKSTGAASGGGKKTGAGTAAAVETAENGSAETDVVEDEKRAQEEFYQYTRFYLFRSLENVLDVSKQIPEEYAGENSLYKNPDDGAYYLLVKKMDTDPEQFNRICNILSEYSMPMDYSSGMDEFFREHMQIIVAGFAMQNLRSV